MVQFVYVKEADVGQTQNPPNDVTRPCNLTFSLASFASSFSVSTITWKPNGEHHHASLSIPLSLSNDWVDCSSERNRATSKQTAKKKITFESAKRSLRLPNTFSGSWTTWYATENIYVNTETSKERENSYVSSSSSAWTVALVATTTVLRYYRCCCFCSRIV